MELHGENDFKIRTYQNAIQRLERVPNAIRELSEVELTAIDGIGKSIASFVASVSSNGESAELIELENNTPSGLLELMKFRGIGTKKLRTLWQEFGVTDKVQLKELVNSDRLLQAKGFGAKTIESLREIVEFAFASEGHIYYAEAEKIGHKILESLDNAFSEAQISFVGKMRRKWETIDNIEILIDQPLPRVRPILEAMDGLGQNKKKSGPFSWRGFTLGSPSVAISVYPSTPANFTRDLFLKTGSPEHINHEVDGEKLIDLVKKGDFNTEEAIYSTAGLNFCEPEIREGSWELALAKSGQVPQLLETSDLKGILHNHSRYSDGQNSLKEMAEACRDLGYEYLGISDHSKAASFYANGMFEERVAQQQKEIDQLNREMAPFRIFKGIESDILADGALDYDDETLRSFDFVVASIHSGLSMDKTKATERLLTAIANPFTTILGHMTGRILLERIGYPVDHEAIINACAEFGVVIEINSHPKRLDIDWRWVHKALDKGVLLSINPDAHEVAGYKDMYYGVCVSRKGGLTSKQTLNAMGLEEIKSYFTKRKKKTSSTTN